MEKITLLYGTSHFDQPDMYFIHSYLLEDGSYLEESGRFHIAFFNYYDFIQGAELKVNVQEFPANFLARGWVSENKLTSTQKPKKRDNPTLLRCPYLDEEQYKKLAHDLLHFGYRLMVTNWEAHHYNSVRHCKGLPTDQYMIESVAAGCSFGSNSHYSLQPTIYTARDEDGAADTSCCKNFFAIGWVNSDESERIAKEFLEYREGKPKGEVFFEKYVPYAVHKRVPVVWRVLYFDRVPFYRKVLYGNGLTYGIKDDSQNIPEPPKEIVDAFASEMDIFGSCDFVLEEAGGWKCSRIMDGQFTKLPYSDSNDDEQFAKAFAKVVEESPHVTKSWCLTAYVKDINTVGEDHHIVHGTRHFAPGTKVWLHDPNWDDRVGVIGIPRYSDKLTRVVMDVKKLENFGVEMVYDKEILAALAHPYGLWPFSKLAPAYAGYCHWDATEESHKLILDIAEMLSEQAKSWG